MKGVTGGQCYVEKDLDLKALKGVTWAQCYVKLLVGGNDLNL